MYFADKIREFGSVAPGTGELQRGRDSVRRWMREFEGLPQDEFIDSIPYPKRSNTLSA
jgi:hypothetical protein